MAWNRFIALVLTSLVLGACSSRVVLRSDPPEAMIWLPDENAGGNRPLGRTPLDLSASQITKTLAASSRVSDFFELVVTKEGYQTEHYFLPVESLSSSELGLLVKLMPDHGQERLAKVMIERLFYVQKLARKGEFKAAHATIDKVLKLWPMFPRALMMKASIFYVQRNYEDSLKWYERALLTESGSDEAARMMLELRKRLGKPIGGRAPIKEERAAVVPLDAASGPAPIKEERAAVAPLDAASGPVPLLPPTSETASTSASSAAPGEGSQTETIATATDSTAAPTAEEKMAVEAPKLQIAPETINELFDEGNAPEANNGKLPNFEGLSGSRKGTTP